MPLQLNELLENNRRHAERFATGGLPPQPALGLAIVACMDARLDVHGCLGLSEGDAHVIRNAGGLVTDDVLRSLVISQWLLGTTQILVIHHTDCGMTHFSEGDLKDRIEAELGQRPAFDMGAFLDLDRSVRESVDRIRRCPYLPATDQVHGFVVDVTTGLLRRVE